MGKRSLKPKLTKNYFQFILFLSC